MIVDCHTHVLPESVALGSAGSFSCLVRSGEGSGAHEQLEAAEPAEVTFVLGFVCDHLGVEIPNDMLARHIKANADRLVGFAGVDPTRSGCLAEVRRLRSQNGFAGLTVSPACQDYHPCDTRAMRVYELAEQLGMPVYFLQGATLPSEAVMQYAQPVHLDEVARAFRSLKMVISHLSNPWGEQTVALLAKHENVYATIAGLADKPWQAYRTLSLAYEYGVMEKLLFGSGFPGHTVKEAVEALYNLNKVTLDSVLPAVPREQLRGIVERDSLRLLGVSPAGRVGGKVVVEAANGADVDAAEVSRAKMLG